MADVEVPTMEDAHMRMSFHVLPPPEHQPKAWREIIIAFCLALLLNLLFFLPFIFRSPVSPPLPAEPDAISVDLVQEPQPPPEPEPIQEDHAEQAPPPEQVETAQKTFTQSGGESDEPPGDPVELEPAQTDSFEPIEPVEEEKTVEPEPVQPSEDIPGWAQTIAPGYDMRAGQQNVTPQQAKARQNAGGGDAYLNAMGKRIHANLRYPVEARGATGVVVYDLLVHRSGALREARLVSSTGNALLDRAAEDALQRSQPFAPFPSGVAAETASLRLTLRVAPRG